MLFRRIAAVAMTSGMLLQSAPTTIDGHILVKERHDLRDELIWNVLANHYPEDEEFFEELDEKSRQLRHIDAAQRKLEDNRVES